MNRKLPGVLLVFFLVLITYAPKASYSRHHQLTGEEITQVLENKLLNYDRRVRPYAGIKPVTVVISLYAIRLYSFSELNKVTFCFFLLLSVCFTHLESILTLCPTFTLGFQD